MIADTIPIETKSNEERGFPTHSHFIVEFIDGSIRDERDTNWSSFAEVEEVDYFGIKKQVSLATLSIKTIQVFHEEMETKIEVPEDCRVYQAFYSEVSFVPTGKRTDTLNGRAVGLVRDGKVIEERFLNARQGEVMGIRL